MAEVEGTDNVKCSNHYYFREEMKKKTDTGCLKTKYVTIAIPNLTVHSKRKTL